MARPRNCEDPAQPGLAEISLMKTMAQTPCRSLPLRHVENLLYDHSLMHVKMSDIFNKGH